MDVDTSEGHSAETETIAPIDLQTEVETPAPINHPAELETPAPIYLPAELETPAPIDRPAELETHSPIDFPTEIETPAPIDLPVDIWGNDDNLQEADNENLAVPGNVANDQLSSKREENSSKEECHVTTGSLKEFSTAKRYRYNRDFLLQFQQDTFVSTKPIPLPTIPDIKRRRNMYKTNTRRSEHARRTGRMKSYRGNGSHRRHNGIDQKPVCTTASRTRDKQIVEEIEINGTCFVVIDFDGNDEDIEMESKTSEAIIGVNTEMESKTSGAIIGVDTEMESKTSATIIGVDTEMQSKSSGAIIGVDTKMESKTRGAIIGVDTETENSISGTIIGFETEIESRRSSGTIDGEDENNEDNWNGNKQSTANETLNYEKNKCLALLTTTTPEIHTGMDNFGRKRTKRSIPNYKKDEKCYKRMRKSPAEVSDKKTITTRLNRREKSMGPRNNIHTYRRGSRVRGSHCRHIHKSSNFGKVSGVHGTHRQTGRKSTFVFDHRNGKDHYCKRNLSNIKTSGTSSPRSFPLLYENGKSVHGESIQDQYSPVSDRSISPYADFSGFFKGADTANEIPNNLDNKNTLNSITNVNPNTFDCYYASSQEEKAYQTAWGHPESVIQRRSLFFGHSFDSDITDTRRVFRNNTNFFRMESLVNPNVYSPLHYQGHQLQYSKGFRHENPYSVNNNVPIQTETFQSFRVSRDSITSLKKDIQEKVIPAIYRKMVGTDRMHFSPDDVIQMMLLNRPIRIEFGTKDDLIHLLRQHEDKFAVQNNESVLSPKTKIEICHTFTNNPGSKHQCMDLHICKYYLLGNCRLQHCKFSHRLSSAHNVTVLRSFDLGEHHEGHVKNLIRDLNSRNTSTTPLICKFYNNEGGCQRGESCNHLHLCTHFINGDCKFGLICRRSHDVEEQQPKVILEKHGIFLDDSNHGQIINLLKATLQHGEVRLKRELSKCMNVDSTISKDTHSVESSDISFIQITGVTKENEALSLNSGGKNSAESTSRDIQGKNEDNKQELGCSDYSFKEQPDERTGESENDTYMQKSLPEFIPLETECSIAEDRNRDVSVRESVNSNMPLIEATVKGANVDKIGYLKSVLVATADRSVHLEQELCSLNQRDALKNETKPHTEDTVSENSMLPPWTPLSPTIECIDSKTVNGTTNEKEQMNLKVNIVDIEIRDDVHFNGKTFTGSINKMKETDKSNANNDTEKQTVEDLETAKELQVKEEDSLDADKSEELSSNLSDEGVEYIKDKNDEMKEVTSKPVVLFEMINEGSCFRVRKLHDLWQQQVTSTSRRPAENDSVFEESVGAWKDMETVADAEILDNIFHLFSGFVNSKPVGNKDC